MLEDNIHQPILISIRGDQELNEVKLSNEISRYFKKPLINIQSISKDELESNGLNEIPFGYLGPDLNDSFLEKANNKWERTFLRFADHTAANLESFICGANKYNYHKIYANWSSLGGLPQIVDIRKALAGDICKHNKEETLIEKRGIEIGHIFQLGRKYSKSLNAFFTNESGIQEPFWMGCYGIGISRLAQSAIEQNHDKEGIIWPLAIAPFEVVVVIANMKDEEQRTLGEQMYDALLKEKIDVLIDDRNERAGVKFKDADLIGIPWKLIAGRDSSKGQVELINRSSKISRLLQSKEAIKELISEISQIR